MNGCLLFIIIIVLCWRRDLGREALALRSIFLRDLEKCIRKKDYLLTALNPRSKVEGELIVYCRQEVRSGELKARRLEALVRMFEEAEDLSLESRHLRSSYYTHLIFVLIVPLLIRLGLGSSWLYSAKDLWVLLSSALLLFLILAALRGYWQEVPLEEGTVALAFARAYLGDAKGTPFEDTVEEISAQFRLEGWSAEGAIEVELAGWFRQQLAEARIGLSLRENALGPLELLASVGFGLLLVGGPLLERFQGLLHLP